MGQNKGLAIKELLAEIAPDDLIAYLGDDLTDEEAFTALDGRGLKVLVRHEFRPTHADVQIAPPEELLQFLDRWAQSQRKV